MQVISSNWLEILNLGRTESKPAVRFEVSSPYKTLYIVPKSYTRYIPYKGLALEGYECGAYFMIQSNSLCTILFSIQDEFPFRLLIKRIV